MKSVKYISRGFDPKYIWWRCFLAEVASVLFPVILHLGFYLHSSGIKLQFPLLSVKTNKQKKPTQQASFLPELEPLPKSLQGNKYQGTQSHQLPSSPMQTRKRGFGRKPSHGAAERLANKCFFVMRACSANAISSWWSLPAQCWKQASTEVQGAGNVHRCSRCETRLRRLWEVRRVLGELAWSWILREECLS